LVVEIGNRFEGIGVESPRLVKIWLGLGMGLEWDKRRGTQKGRIVCCQLV